MTPVIVPVVTRELLAECSRLAFKPILSTVPVFGVFETDDHQERPLYLVSLDGSSPMTRWTLAPYDLAIPVLIDRLAYNLLHQGARVGAFIRWEERRYQLAVGWDGSRPIALPILLDPEVTTP